MAIANTEYLLLKGKVALVERNATTGVTGKVLYVGNCPALKLSLKTEKIEHFESQSGNNQLDRSIVKTIGAEVGITLENIASEIAALLVWSEPVDIAAQAAQLDTLNHTIANGETYLLSHQNITSITHVKDSTAVTPVTVDVADYSADLVFGSIKFIDVTGYVQPFKVTYACGAVVAVPFFAADQPVRFLRFEGINKGNPGNSKKYLVELYNLPLEPVSDMDLIGDDLAKFEMKAAALIDSTREDDPTLGQFGRIVYVA